MNPGGKGANQAVAVARLGGRVTFVCKTGSDIFGHQACQIFMEEGIDASFVFSDTKNPSGVALITVDDRAENCIVVAPGANAHLTVEDLHRSVRAIEAADIVLLQLEIPMETVEEAAVMAHRLGKKVVLNPAPASELSSRLLGSLFAITPNETEAEKISGIRITDEASAEYAADASLRWGCAMSSLRSASGAHSFSTANTARGFLRTRCRRSIRRQPETFSMEPSWSHFPKDVLCRRRCASPAKPPRSPSRVSERKVPHLTVRKWIFSTDNQ